MKARELLELTDARRKPTKGRRDRVTVRNECQTWARRHQEILRRAFRHLEEDLDLTVGLSDEELVALGGIRLALAGGRVAWSCEVDDHTLELRILGLAAAPALVPTATTPELFDGHHPGHYVVVRRVTDGFAEPVYKGARR